MDDEPRFIGEVLQPAVHSRIRAPFEPPALRDEIELRPIGSRQQWIDYSELGRGPDADEGGVGVKS